MTPSTKEVATQFNYTNGLILYHNPSSYYCQKVVMVLHEKRLPFTSHLIDLRKGDVFMPWFLKLNPRAEIPVLQDTGKIIPDSTRIIDYLEDNFSNGTPRLVPLDQGPEIKQNVIYYRTILDEIEARPLTYGSLAHPEFVRCPRLPFIGPARKFLLIADKNKASVIRKHASLNVEAQDALNQKATVFEKNSGAITNKLEYFKVLEEVDIILTAVENQLVLNLEGNEDWWLCSDRFTIADISLVVLLERLSQLGYEYRFWRDGIRPNLEKYYQRAKQRSSYRKTIPTNFLLFKMFLSTFKQQLIISFVGFAIISFVIGSGFCLLKHLK